MLTPSQSEGGYGWKQVTGAIRVEREGIHTKVWTPGGENRWDPEGLPATVGHRPPGLWVVGCVLQGYAYRPGRPACAQLLSPSRTPATTQCAPARAGHRGFWGAGQEGPRSLLPRSLCDFWQGV